MEYVDGKILDILRRLEMISRHCVEYHELYAEYRAYGITKLSIKNQILAQSLPKDAVASLEEIKV